MALRSAYRRIGFSAKAALVITYAKGIDSLEELDILTYREIENLYKVVRRPGRINLITITLNYRSP